MTSPVLTTERLTLRRPTAEDAPSMIDFYVDDRSRFYGGPKDKGAAWRDFASRVGHWELRGFGMFAVVDRARGETIGLAGPWYPSDFPEPEMAWLLFGARHEGKGFATEACRAALDHVFAAHGWPSLPSYIDPDNAASLALAARLGAVLDTSAPTPVPGWMTYRHFPAEMEARA